MLSELFPAQKRDVMGQHYAPRQSRRVLPTISAPAAGIPVIGADAAAIGLAALVAEVQPLVPPDGNGGTPAAGAQTAQSSESSSSGGPLDIPQIGVVPDPSSSESSSSSGSDSGAGADPGSGADSGSGAASGSGADSGSGSASD